MPVAYRGRISRTHPAMPGHFPGDPIVPGVVLLTETLRAMERAFARPVRVVEFAAVKFTAPLHPGEPFTITLDPADEEQMAFTVTRGETPIASGILRHTGAAPKLTADG